MFSRLLSIRSIVGCVLLGIAGTTSAQVASLNFRVDGLPSGLQVVARASFVSCPVGAGSSGGVELAEDSFTTFDRIIMPGGQIVFTTNVHHFYAGTLQIVPPTNNGCDSITNGSFKHEFAVVGSSPAGNPTTRTIGTGGAILSGNSINIRDTLRAEATQITKNGIVPTSLRFGFQQVLRATYEDSAGGSAIRNPTIELTRQVNFNGLLLNSVIARAVLNPSNQVCVTSGGETACRLRSSGGTVTAGILSVNLNALNNTVGGKERNVDWPIAVDSSVGTGSFGISVKADDFDSISYFVNGNPEDIDLLPWKSLRIPVDLVN
jgi:hypothetical protein